MSLILGAAISDLNLANLTIVRKVEGIDYDLRQILSSNEEEKTVVLSNHDPFFGPIGQGLITVHAGFKASFRFDYRINGVTSRYLADSDQIYRAALNDREQYLYDLSKRLYDGGLDIPFLNELGLNLNKSRSESKIQKAITNVKNYSVKAIAARRIMESFRGGRLRINGSISAVGVSTVPSRASVYVKVSRVTLIDETVLHVVSTNAKDIIAGDGFNNVLPIESIDAEITQENGGNPLLD